MAKVRSSLITKLVLLTVVVYAVVALLSLSGKIKDAEANYDALSQQVAVASLENEKIKADIDQYSEESTEDIARNELGLVSNGEILFYDVGN